MGSKCKGYHMAVAIYPLFITSLQWGQCGRVSMEPMSAPSTWPPLPLLLHSSERALHFFLKRYLIGDSSVIQPKILHCFLAKARKTIVEWRKNLTLQDFLVHFHHLYHCKQKHIQIREVRNKIIACCHYFFLQHHQKVLHKKMNWKIILLFGLTVKSRYIYFQKWETLKVRIVKRNKLHGINCSSLNQCKRPFTKG